MLFDVFLGGFLESKRPGHIQVHEHNPDHLDCYACSCQMCLELFSERFKFVVFHTKILEAHQEVSVGHTMELFREISHECHM